LALFPHINNLIKPKTFKLISDVDDVKMRVGGSVKTQLSYDRDLLV